MQGRSLHGKCQPQHQGVKHCQCFEYPAFLHQTSLLQKLFVFQLYAVPEHSDASPTLARKALKSPPEIWMGAILTWPDYILDNYPTNITLKTHLPQNNISGPKQELDNGKAGNELCSEGKVQIWGQHAVCHGVLSLCHQLRGGDSETRQPEWNNFPSAPPLPTTPPGPCESILINLSVSWSRPEQARESRFSTALPIFSFNPEESWPEMVTTSIMKAFHWNRFILVLYSQTFSSGAHSVDCTQHRS